MEPIEGPVRLQFTTHSTTIEGCDKAAHIEARRVFGDRAYTLTRGTSRPEGQTLNNTVIAWKTDYEADDVLPK